MNYGQKYYLAHKERSLASSKAWQQRNRDKHRGYVVKRKYGVSLEQYKSVLADGCAICGGKATQLDHNHTTGRIRGGLCGACNRGIGMFCDKPELLDRAARYLREPSIH